MLTICPNFDLQGLVVSFASIVGTLVAAVLLAWLKTVVSNLQDTQQQNSLNDADRIRKQ